LVWIDAGEQTTFTEVIVDVAVTVTLVVPNLVVSSVAVMVTVPVAEGVNTPAEVIAPTVVDHVTPEL
jgi:hypothetical protein